MGTTALSVWHSFLQSSSPEKRSQLLLMLSPEVAEELKPQPILSIDVQKGSEPIEEELLRIHASWLAPLLRTLPENEIKLFISSLSPEQIKGLKHSLLWSNSIPATTDVGKTFLRQKMFDMIAGSEAIPPAFLPSDPLNCLLELSVSELSSIIELLSMHDLSVEIRQIIETSKLKQIYAVLSKPQHTFLKTLLHKKEPVSFKKMGLANWRGDRDLLRAMLLQRGINRIAKSLYERNPWLLWYVAHRLDVEKGQLMIKLCTALDHPRASDLLTDQVIELVQTLKNPNPLPPI